MGRARRAVCRGAEFGVGAWVAEDEAPPEPQWWPDCDRRLGGAPPLDASDPVRKFVHRGRCKPLPEGNSGNGCLRCDGFRDRYVWQPSLCALRPWSAAGFCGALGARTLLMIGDSTVLQLFLRLNNVLAAGPRANCTCAGRLFFGASGTLEGRAMGRFGYGTAWPRLVDAVRPDILLVGVGAHIYGAHTYRAVVTSFDRELRRRYPSLTVLWRANAPFGCSHTGAPLAALPDARFWATHAPPLYNHLEAWERDGFARVLLGARVVWLEFRPLWLRADAHPGVWSGNRTEWAVAPQAVRDSRAVTDGFSFHEPRRGAAGDCFHQCLNARPIHYLILLLHETLLGAQ
jgi:hypothetical protein